MEPKPEADPANWSVNATLRQEEYFNRHLDGKQSPDDAKLEPELTSVLTKLYGRQREGAFRLLEEALGRLSPDGDTVDVLTSHKQVFRENYRAECRGFAEERERYIADYRRSQDIRRGMDEQERREALERRPDDDKRKLTP